jgi:ribosome-binding protein aMBF1 (putative translation factor)
MDVAQLMGKQMTRYGITRAQIAQAVGVKPNAVRTWEEGTRRPQPEYWSDLAKVLRVGHADVSVAYGHSVPVRKPTFRERALGAEAEVKRLRELLDRSQGSTP